MENMFKIIDITLNQSQMHKFEAWKAHIKALYGEVGLLTWKITPNGIGESLSVYSHNAKVELELTEINSW